MRRAISARCKPSASILITSAALAQAVGFRPLPAFVFPVLLRLRHAFSLPLQQEAAFELRDSAEHGDHQLAGRGAGIDLLTAHAQHDQADTTAIQVIHNPQEVCGAFGKAIGLASYYGIPTADEAQSFLQPIALCHGRHLFGEDFFASGSLQIADLSVQPGLLVAR